MTMRTADRSVEREVARYAGVRGRDWPFAAGCFGVALALFLALYHETLIGLLGIYYVSDTFGHGFLIPLVTAALVWYRRKRLAAVTPRPAAIGLLGLAGLAGVWFVARLADVQLVEHAAFVATIPCLVLAILGWRVVWTLLFPLFYLVFMIPVGEFLIPPLQDITADFVVWWLRLIGIPIFRDGIFLYIPSGAFEVAEACAGLRFLIAMIVLGVLFANITFYTWSRRLLFMLLAVAIPIVANGFRALMIVLVAYWSDHTIAVGVDHIIFGWVFLTFVTVLILAVGMAMRERTPPPERPEDELPPGPPARPASRTALVAATVAGVVVLAAAPAFAFWRATHPPELSVELSLPAEAAGWTRQDVSADAWKPVFVGPDVERLVRYARGDVWVDVYVAYYAYQRRDAEAVNYANTLHRLAEQPEGVVSQLDSVPDPWSRVTDHRFAMAVGGEERTVTGVHLRSLDRERRLVLPLYWVAGQITQSGVEAKLLQLEAVLTGGSEAAAGLVLAAPFAEDPDDAAAILRDFAPALADVRAGLAAAAP
jgi:exosortase A